MARPFLAFAVSLAATVAFLVGLIVAGSMTPAPAHSAPDTQRAPARTAGERAPLPVPASFADVAERLNPAVVSIDARTRSLTPERQRPPAPLPDGPELFNRPPAREREAPRRGAGTGFIIDAGGHILTNHHVIHGAEQITVRLSSGRSLRAEPVGSDPDTDIALIRVQSPGPLPYAVLGNSDALRVGDWVLAIGNPLAYEHTVTAGVVSFLGRKIFDSSFDRYIQTDAAINFGNSGGPLINTRGEVVGINAAISSRAANIGFAVPINQARAILPQLRANGRVSRGYIGVAVRDVDDDLRRSLGLRASGAIVQDVTPGSPGARAGLRTYDLIVAVDGAPVAGNDDLIERIAARTPGTTATVQILRDGRAMTVPVKLAERPPRDRAAGAVPEELPQPSSQRGSALGLSVRELDREYARRVDLPADAAGVVIARVDPWGSAFDADVERGWVLLEINRQPVRSVADYRRLTSGLRSGDVVALYVFKPDVGRALHTVRVD
jgi:serine protease Do